MNDVELSIRMTADAQDAAAAMDDVGDAALRMGDDVERGSRNADAATERLDNVAESADGVASKGAQAAGALSGLGDLVGGKFGSAMVVGGVAMQAFADAGDLVNVVTESNIVRKAKDIVVTTAKRTADLASAAASKTMAAAQWALNAAMSANPIGLVVVAAIALVAAFVLLYKRSERFRAIVHAVMAASRAAVMALWDVLKKVGDYIGGALSATWRVLQRAAQLAWRGIQLYIRVVVTVIRTYLTVYKTVATAVFNAVKDVALRVWAAIKTYVGTQVAIIKTVATTLRDKFADVWRAIKDKALGAFDAITGPIQDAIDLVQRLLDKIADIDLPDLNPLHHLPGLGRAAVGSSTTAGVSSSITPVVININVEAGIGDPIAIAATVQSVLQRRNVFLGVS